MEIRNPNCLLCRQNRWDKEREEVESKPYRKEERRTNWTFYTNTRKREEETEKPTFYLVAWLDRSSIFLVCSIEAIDSTTGSPSPHRSCRTPIPYPCPSHHRPKPISPLRVNPSSSRKKPTPDLLVEWRGRTSQVVETPAVTCPIPLF